MNQRLFGIVMVLISAITYGLLGIFGRLAFQKGLKAGETLAVRFFIASFFMWLFVLLKKRNKLSKFSFIQIRDSALLGIFGFALLSLFYFLALENLSASMTVLLLYTYPMMVAMLSFLFLKEKLHQKQILSIILGFIGVILLIGGDLNIQNKIGFIYGLACAFVYASYIVASHRRLKEVDTVVSITIVQTFTFMTLGAFYLKNLNHAMNVFTQAPWEILSLAIVVSIVPMITFNIGLKHLKATDVAILSTLEPVTAIIVAYFLFGEVLNFMQLLGAIVVLTSLLITGLKKE